jgi:hypothetical protein
VNQLPSHGGGYASGMPLQPIETNTGIRPAKRSSRNKIKVQIDADGLESPRESSDSKKFVMHDLRHVKLSATRKHEQNKANVDG